MFHTPSILFIPPSLAAYATRTFSGQVRESGACVCAKEDNKTTGRESIVEQHSTAQPTHQKSTVKENKTTQIKFPASKPMPCARRCQLISTKRLIKPPSILLLQSTEHNTHQDTKPLLLYCRVGVSGERGGGVATLPRFIFDSNTCVSASASASAHYTHTHTHNQPGYIHTPTQTKQMAQPLPPSLLLNHPASHPALQHYSTSLHYPSPHDVVTLARLSTLPLHPSTHPFTHPRAARTTPVDPRLVPLLSPRYIVIVPSRESAHGYPSCVRVRGVCRRRRLRAVLVSSRYALLRAPGAPRTATP